MANAIAYNQRRFRLEESVTRNGGARTVFIEHMAPNTAVPAHYHLRFSETFDLISGSLTVYASSQDHSVEPDLAALESSAQTLTSHSGPVTVSPGVYHKYVAAPITDKGAGTETILKCTLTPGDADFERLLMILNGLANDGRLDEQLGNDPRLAAVVFG